MPRKATDSNLDQGTEIQARQAFHAMNSEANYTSELAVPYTAGALRTQPPPNLHGPIWTHYPSHYLSGGVTKWGSVGVHQRPPQLLFRVQPHWVDKDSWLDIKCEFQLDLYLSIKIKPHQPGLLTNAMRILRGHAHTGGHDNKGEFDGMKTGRMVNKPGPFN